MTRQKTVHLCGSCEQQYDTRAEAKACEYSHLTPEQAIASTLHDAFCHWNHTDGCGWFYESWTNPGFSRKKHLVLAKEWITFLLEHPDVTLEDLLTLLSKRP